MPEAKKLTNLWHSALVKMTADGAIPVKIKQKPTKSRYPNKPPYAILIIDGVDYAYNVESAVAEKALADYAGKTVMLTADGRDEDATIEILIGAAQDPGPQAQTTPGRRAPAPRRGPEPDYEPEPQPTRPTSPAPATGREEAFGRCVKENIKFTKSHAKGMYMCLRAVREAGREFHAMFPDEPPITAETEASFVATIFISGDKMGIWEGMPYKALENYL